ncbi:hypothetical protein LINPERPRIM_LOCUS36278 [Linum perenne]
MTRLRSINMRHSLLSIADY